MDNGLADAGLGKKAMLVPAWYELNHRLQVSIVLLSGFFDFTRPWRF
jgi:hypothetical protein